MNTARVGKWMSFKRTGYGGIGKEFPVFMLRKIQIITLPVSRKIPELKLKINSNYFCKQVEKRHGFYTQSECQYFCIKSLQRMTKRLKTMAILICFLLTTAARVAAQCSICTKTAQQLGEGPAKGLNSAILYLAFFPLVLIGFIGYRWWRTNKDE